MTTEPNPAPVSQMAREAAAEIFDLQGAHNYADICRQGGDLCDSLVVVRIVAGFEQAIRSTQVGEDSNG